MNRDPLPSSRNALCPCGSGRRYKDCHGALSSGVASPIESDQGKAVASSVRSLYRPRGPDWDHLAEPDRAACGLLMQRALKHQVAGRLAEAAANYEEVLVQAPGTHDALHMLGAIELRRGNFAEAKKLILAALRLRPPYPDIEHNLRMAEDLERAARVDAGRPATPREGLCEKALPALVDLALRPKPTRYGAQPADPAHRSPQPIHLIAGVSESNDDGAWLLRRIAALLAADRPIVWAGAHERGAAWPSGRFAPNGADFPDGGTHVFVGMEFDGAAWIDRGQSERVIVFCQPAPPSECLRQLRAISRDGARAVELVFPSRAMAHRFGAGHAVLPPPIAADFERDPLAPCGFAAGLIGRHWQGTSPGEDAEFLRGAAAASGALELYDPGALRYVVGGNSAVRCRTRGATALRAFMRSVDCILHTGGKWWLEGDGREWLMAMAGGVPIIAPRASLFAEYIEHGVDGLLYGERGEALEHIAALRREPARRMALGQAARAKVAPLIAPERVADRVRRLMRGEPAALQASGGGIARAPLPAK
jgi:hypothetical protein